MTCPDCDGKGYTWERYDPDRPARMRCGTCHGDGDVTPEPDDDEAA